MSSVFSTFKSLICSSTVKALTGICFLPDFEEIKGLSPEQFVRSIVENCHAKALFCGENFTFGAKAAGRCV